MLRCTDFNPGMLGPPYSSTAFLEDNGIADGTSKNMGLLVTECSILLVPYPPHRNPSVELDQQ